MKTSIFEKYKKMPELDVFACILKNELILNVKKERTRFWPTFCFSFCTFSSPSIWHIDICYCNIFFHRFPVFKKLVY